MAFSFWASAGEALVLGLATGPVCLASCGPVVLPWMLVQPEGVRAHGRQLSVFLAARLVGYLVFATVAWYVGAAIPRAWSGRSWIFGGIELLLAVALVVYAVGWPRRRCAVQASSGVTGADWRATARAAFGSRGAGLFDGNQPLPAVSGGGGTRGATGEPARGARVLRIFLCGNGGVVSSVPFSGIGAARAGGGDGGAHGCGAAGVLVPVFGGFDFDWRGLSQG